MVAVVAAVAVVVAVAVAIVKKMVKGVLLDAFVKQEHSSAGNDRIYTGYPDYFNSFVRDSRFGAYGGN